MDGKKCRCVTNVAPDYERILTSKCHPSSDLAVTLVMQQ